MKEVIPVHYISERVTNISGLEDLISSARYAAEALQKELDKENPQISRIRGLADQIVSDLKNAESYEFCVERRKTVSDFNF